MDSAATAARPSFIILVAISAIGPLALNIFMPSMPGLQGEFGITYGVAQMTLTLYLIGMALSQLDLRSPVGPLWPPAHAARRHVAVRDRQPAGRHRADHRDC